LPVLSLSSNIAADIVFAIRDHRALFLERVQLSIATLLSSARRNFGMNAIGE